MKIHLHNIIVILGTRKDRKNRKVYLSIQRMIQTTLSLQGQNKNLVQSKNSNSHEQWVFQSIFASSMLMFLLYFHLSFFNLAFAF